MEKRFLMHAYVTLNTGVFYVCELYHHKINSQDFLEICENNAKGERATSITVLVTDIYEIVPISADEFCKAVRRRRERIDFERVERQKAQEVELSYDDPSINKV
ncbi:MAG: hypothetical protein ACE5DO_15790, partial [Desulfobacterales bacterium]